MEKFQEGSVGPAEADNIDGVAAGSGGFGGAIHGVVFFADGAITAEVFGNGAYKFVGKPVGVFVVAVATESLHDDKLDRSPRVRRIPLRAGFVGAGHKTAGPFEVWKIFYDGFRLFLGRQSGPERVEGGRVFVYG